MLLRAGARLEERNHWGSVALALAASIGQCEVVELLLRKGASKKRILVIEVRSRSREKREETAKRTLGEGDLCVGLFAFNSPSSSLLSVKVWK